MSPALLVLVLASAAPSIPAETVLDPVEDVAAFYLERCSEKKPLAQKQCEASVLKTRRQAERTRYLARIALARLHRAGALTVQPWNPASGEAAVEAVLGMVADESSDASGACLVLGPDKAPGKPVRLGVPFASAQEAAEWERRVKALLVARPGPALDVELLFTIGGETTFNGQRCAAGRFLALRLLDRERGEILAERSDPAAAGALSERPRHRSLAAATRPDALQAWLDQVRLAVRARLIAVGSTAAVEARVRIFVDPGGQLRERRLEKPSADAGFDRAVLDAIDRSAPFPPPPPDLAASLQRQGVILQLRR